MERLTVKHYLGSAYYMKCSEECNVDMDCIDCPAFEKLVDRLGAYEDTGLEPEKIAFLKSVVDDAFSDNPNFTERLRELAQADREGRVVVLPCKIGDAIYMPSGRYNHIPGYEEDVCDGFHIAKDGILQIKARCWEGNHGTYGVPGKTVFLTREAADKALGGGRD